MEPTVLTPQQVAEETFRLTGRIDALTAAVEALLAIAASRHDLTVLDSFDDVMRPLLQAQNSPAVDHQGLADTAQRLLALTQRLRQPPAPDMPLQ